MEQEQLNLKMLELINSISDKLNTSANSVQSAAKKDLNLNDVKSIYIRSIKPYRRQDTIIMYIKLLDEIIDYFFKRKIYNVSQLNMNSVMDYVFYSQCKKHKNTTINKKILTLKRAINTCVDLSQLDNNPIFKYKKLPEEQAQIQTIKSNDAFNILHEAYNMIDCNDPRNHFAYWRNYIGLLIIYDSGVRLNELMNIKIKNIFLDHNKIFLEFTKTKIKRFIFITKDTSKAIKLFLDHNYYSDNDFLMKSYINKSLMDKRSFCKWLRNISNKLGITYSTSPHKWRHTLATDIITSTGNIELVRKVLGHSSIQTSQLYLHLQDDYISNELNKIIR